MQKPGEGEVTGPIDLDKTTTTLEPDGANGGGLYIPGKDRVVFRPPERKSLLGLDVLASAKRGGSKTENSFKVPRERVASVVSAIDEETSTVTGELDDVPSRGSRSHTSRRYRDSVGSEASISGITVTEGRENETVLRPRSDEHHQVPTPSTGRSRTSSSSHDFDHGRESKSRDDYRSKSREARRDRIDGEEHRHRESSRNHGKEYNDDSRRKRSRYESPRNTRGRLYLHLLVPQMVKCSLELDDK